MTDLQRRRLIQLQLDVEQIAITAECNKDEPSAMAFCKFPGSFEEWRWRCEMLAREAWTFADEIVERVIA